MKTLSFFPASFILFVLLNTVLFARQENIVSLDAGKPWSRDANTLTLTKEESRYRAESRGKQDWAISTGTRLPVKPGELYEITGKAEVEGTGHFGPCVVLRDAGGKEIDWTYALTTRRGGEKSGEMATRFMIPKNVSTIEPRLIGHGEAVVFYSDFTMRPTGRIDIETCITDVAPLENRYLRVEFSSGNETFSVIDKRCGRHWTQDETQSDWLVLRRETLSPDSVLMKLYSVSCLLEAEAIITLDAEAPELSLQLNARGAMPRSLLFPAPFITKKGDRIILPMNEGIGVPVDEPDTFFSHFSAYTYGGHGLCMAFGGIADDASGAAQLALIETPDDAAIQLRRDASKLLRPQHRWDAQKKEFGYPRRLRLAFFDQGGFVAMTKRYRRYAKETGLLVTFEEKIKRNPKLREGIDTLLGAANIWCWDKDQAAHAAELQRAGFERILWSAGGSAEEVARMNAMPNVLTSRYDIFQDIMDPAQRPNLNGWHGDWIAEAWPNDIMWSSPDGTWTKGWAVPKKGETKPTIPCGVLCDCKAPEYARKKIADERRTKMFKARFIDTTTASAWRECWHPDHPMTRTESRIWKMKLLELMGREFDLVCGSETGHDAAVPYCDFFEGMLSLGPFRVPDSGRNMAKIWDEVPERVAKYQVGETYRLPLWELVYHDCCVATWYWGDYNNKLPAVWDKRDLFNALYGTPPMYMFTWKMWNEQKDRFIASGKISLPVARLTAYREMTDFKILSEDRTVQQSVFAGGITVTVNFGDKAFRMADGFSLEPMKSRIRQ